MRIVRRALAGVALLSALLCSGQRQVTGESRPCPGPAATATAAADVVTVESSAGHRPQTATGFLVAPRRVVTVAHAVEGATGPPVVSSDRTGPMPARLLVVDMRRDLAVLDVPALQTGGLLPAASASPPGACAAVLVERSDRAQKVPALIRRSVRITIDVPVPAERGALELAAEIGRGDSGAPVIDASGLVEGVVFAASRDGRATAWAVSASELRGLLADNG